MLVFLTLCAVTGAQTRPHGYPSGEAHRAQQRTSNAGGRKTSAGPARRGVSKSTMAASNATTGPRGITSWPTGKRLVALTYDDGPNPKFTPRLLQILAQKQVKSTFYVLGEQVREFPSVLAATAQAGHEIGDHSYDHKQLTKLSAEGVGAELDKTAEAVTSVTGSRMNTMRPPYGSYNSAVYGICRQRGYEVILWDVDTSDWRRRSSQDIIETVLRETRDGSIILMHDRLQNSLEATPAIIDGLRQKGFEFVTVSELLAHPRLSKVSAASSAPLTTPSYSPEAYSHQP